MNTGAWSVFLPASFCPTFLCFQWELVWDILHQMGQQCVPEQLCFIPKASDQTLWHFFPWWSREANYPPFCSDFSSYLKKKNNLSNSFSNSSPLLLSFSLITEDSSVKCTEALYFWMLERLWLFTACAGLFVFSVCYAGPWTFDLALNDKEAWTVSLYIRQVKQGL